MDNSLTPEKREAVLEDALHTYPVAQIPRDLTMDVISRIQTVPTQRPFRFPWSDFLISLVLALCIGAIWFSVQNLPPIVMAQIRKEGILLYQQILVNARWLIPVLSFGFAGCFAALTLPYLRQQLMK